jgi:Ni/Co efflux regulator RcnB
VRTPIAKMIVEMHGKGIPVELIAVAVETLEEAMAAQAVSTGNPVDTKTIDKRRAWDRERKRREREAKNMSANSTGNPQIPPECPPDTSCVLREEVGIQEVVEGKKESKTETEPRTRGTRVPPDFHLDADDYKFAASLDIPPDAVDAETRNSSTTGSAFLVRRASS